MSNSVVASEESSSLTTPPGRLEYTDGVKPITIPFEVYRSDIRYQCEINGHPVYMLLDDGYMWDQLLFWGGPKVDSLGLVYDGTIGVGKPDDTAALLQSKTASGITVIFPGVTLHEQTAIITPSSSGNSSMWYGSAGQISAMLFKHFVVDINFDKMTLTLHPKETFEYQGSGQPVEWSPLGFGPWGIPATLELADGRHESLTLFMDLGYNDQLLLSLGGPYKVPLPEKAIPASLGFNIQYEETRGYIGRLPSISIGSYTVKDVVIAYTESDDTFNAMPEKMIGLNLLRRFNLIFDYDRRKLYIEPNNDFKKQFDINMSGLTLGRFSGEGRPITAIYPDSPAGKVELEVGDIITHLNGKKIQEYTIREREKLFIGAGKKVALTVLTQNGSKEITLTLRPVI